MRGEGHVGEAGLPRVALRDIGLRHVLRVARHERPIRQDARVTQGASCRARRARVALRTERAELGEIELRFLLLYASRTKMTPDFFLHRTAAAAVRCTTPGLSNATVPIMTTRTRLIWTLLPLTIGGLRAICHSSDAGATASGLDPGPSSGSFAPGETG